MTAEIVNLRRARKAKARADRAQQAEQNRIEFGRSKAERTQTAAIRRLEEVRHEGALREGSHSQGGDRHDGADDERP
jgi:hypothetical protein